MNETITIPKHVNSEDDLDFDFLRKAGIEYIEKIGSKLWTDYNIHDPGITMLEMLSYAITDLALRIEMPVQNLLASEFGNLTKMHEQFLSAVNILPSKPITPLDYRKLFVRHKGVKNAWIVRHEQKVYLSCKDGAMSYLPFETEAHDQKEFTIRGLNDIYIDLQDHVEDPEAVFDDIKNIYHKNRNLCEDLVHICKVPEHPIYVCVDLDIEPEADEDRIQASIIKSIEHYLAPSVPFYSLQQMYDKGYTTDRIFEGPIPFPGSCLEPDDHLRGGFIDSNELSRAGLKTEVRRSDIIKIIMNIDGVRVIKDISVQSCHEDSQEQDPWIICIKSNHKPVLCRDDGPGDGCDTCKKSIFNFSKRQLPVAVNRNRVKILLEEFDLQEAQEGAKTITEDVAFPTGKYSKVGEYATIQHDFPQTYGISPSGLPSDATNERKAKARQLKAYLLFFEQVLANYFSHLSKVKDLLSIDENLKKIYTVNAISELSAKEKQTYFSQKISDITDLETLTDDSTYENDLIEILNRIKNNSPGGADKTYYDRRNKLLDHLIARFAERFSDYAFVMKMIYGESNANYEVLKAKAKFVEDYKSISCMRGLGFNYCCPAVWDTENVSGAQKRIARLAGISDYSRRNLLSDSIEIYDEKDRVDDHRTEYRWRIKNGDEILISSSKHYHLLSDALEELFLAFELAKRPEHYDLKKTGTGKTYFNIINPAVTDKQSEDYIVARRIAYTFAEERSAAKRDEIIAYLKDLSACEEGMYLIEHILLRPDIYESANTDKNKSPGDMVPDAEPETFMPICIDDECKTCDNPDPYSFRVTVVLPGWTARFANKDFRVYMERLIREEIPAHVLARICWIGHVKGVVKDEDNDMLQIREKYRGFLEQLKIKCHSTPLIKDEIIPYRDRLKDLIRSLERVHTIYPAGKLHDCDDDNAETKGNKIVLGRTNIGNL